MTKTVENTGFLPDDKIEITGYEFALFSVAYDQFLETMRQPAFPIRYKFVDNNDEPIENPTEEQFKNGEVKEILDVQATFSKENAIEAYCGKITYQMLEAMRTRYEIHHREIMKGNSKSIDELEAGLKKIEEDNKLEVVKDER